MPKPRRESMDYYCQILSGRVESAGCADNTVGVREIVFRVRDLATQERPRDSHDWERLCDDMLSYRRCCTATSAYNPPGETHMRVRVTMDERTWDELRALVDGETGALKPGNQWHGVFAHLNYGDVHVVDTTPVMAISRRRFDDLCAEIASFHKQLRDAP